MGKGIGQREVRDEKGRLLTTRQFANAGERLSSRQARASRRVANAEPWRFHSPSSLTVRSAVCHCMTRRSERANN